MARYIHLKYGARLIAAFQAIMPDGSAVESVNRGGNRPAGQRMSENAKRKAVTVFYERRLHAVAAA